MAKEKTKAAPAAPAQNANDVLESAEVLRAANIMARMAFGIVTFSNSVCSAEVVTENELKEFATHFDYIQHLYQRVYASYMGRYSALESSKVGQDDKSAN